MAQLSDAQRAFLQDNPFVGTVTTLRDDGSPHSTVVWVDATDDAVLFNSPGTGAKVRHIRADPRISVWAPLQGARSVSGQHGPGLLVCGTMDTTVPCSGASSAFDRIESMPVMYAELKAASHVNWIAGGRMHPYAVATTGWFRVHLMGDTALKPMFYGPMCQLCTDAAWVIKQKMLD